MDVDVKLPEKNIKRTNPSDRIRTTDNNSLRNNSNEESISCPFCNKCFPHLVTLERHIDRLHSDVYYQLDGTRGNKSVITEVQADISKQENINSINLKIKDDY